ncbi:MAG: DUF6232 family protein [Oscillospiraceae bacterium]|nr:hypothetical protein [Bacillota bacterium]
MAFLRVRMLFLRGVSRKKEELRLTASIVTDKVKLSVTCEKWGGTMMANLKLKREINVGSVRVHGNCMEFGNTAVQLSNISSLSTSEVKTSLLGGVIILLIGFALLFVHWLLGGVFILAGVFVLFALLENNVEYILSISTNAGGNFSIVFESDYFLRKVYDVLIEIIANPEKENDANINITSQKIEVKKVEFKDYATLQNFEGAHS